SGISAKSAGTNAVCCQGNCSVRPAGAVPQVIFVAPPQFPWQQTAFVPADLAEIPEVVPLRNDQVWFNRTAKFEENLVECPLVGDLGKAEHLATEGRRLR